MSTPESESANVDVMLATVYNLHERRCEIDWQVTTLITWARQQGATWAAIAEALDVSPQAAWKKYARHEPREIMPGQDTLPIE